MAAIDFPASPADGALFRPSLTGITYQFSASPSPGLWKPVQSGTSPGGDFCAVQTSAFPTMTATATTILFTQIISGNSGGWYSSSTGRWTPPAGRYAVRAGMSGQTTITSHFDVFLRKNGVVLLQDRDTTAAASFAASAVAEVTVDMNGTDWIDVQGAVSGGGTNTLINMTFEAFPISGIQGPPGPPGTTAVGDFSAVRTDGAITVGVTATTLVPTTILSGNSGGFYATGGATPGRYTPPAGRYVITAGAYISLSTGITTAGITLRKNGVLVMDDQDTTAGNSMRGNPHVMVTLDMNGTDWVDFQGYSANGGSANVHFMYFSAFPISGIQGPPGPAPTGDYWRMLKRIVPTAGQATVDINPGDIPADINNLMFSANALPQTNDVGFFIRVADAAGTFDTAANYFSNVALSQSNATVGGGSVVSTDTVPAGSGPTAQIRTTFNQAGNGVSNAANEGILVEGRIANIRQTTLRRRMIFNSYYWQGNNNSMVSLAGGASWQNTTSIIGGLRFYFGTGNFAAGGAITLWGSP